MNIIHILEKIHLSVVLHYDFGALVVKTKEKGRTDLVNMIHLVRVPTPFAKAHIRVWLNV